jgi:hypothetical protein
MSNQVVDKREYVKVFKTIQVGIYIYYLHKYLST